MGFFFIKILHSGAGHRDAHPWVGTMLAPQQMGTAHPIVLRHQGAEELPGHALKADSQNQSQRILTLVSELPNYHFGEGESTCRLSVHNASYPRRSLLTISKDFILPPPPASALLCSKEASDALWIHSHGETSWLLLHCLPCYSVTLSPFLPHCHDY